MGANGSGNGVLAIGQLVLVPYFFGQSFLLSFKLWSSSLATPLAQGHHPALDMPCLRV